MRFHIILFCTNPNVGLVKFFSVMEELGVLSPESPNKACKFSIPLYAY